MKMITYNTGNTTDGNRRTGQSYTINGINIYLSSLIRRKKQPIKFIRWCVKTGFTLLESRNEAFYVVILCYNLTGWILDSLKSRYNSD